MILLDFSPISIAAAFLSGEEMSEDLVRHLTLNSILSHKKKLGNKYGEMVVAMDDHNYWRKDIHPAYKGHRAKAKAESSFDWSAFYKHQDSIKAELARVFPYRWLQFPRLEADDIIGHLALTAKEDTVIVSPDGDFKQCMRNPRVRVFSTLKKSFLPAETMFEVEFALHEKIMKGDGGDNIRNVLSTLDGTERQKPVTKRLIEHTYECGLAEDLRARYEENANLIDLRRIPKEYKEMIEAAMEQPIEGSKARVFNYLTQKKLNRIGSFISEVDHF